MTNSLTHLGSNIQIRLVLHSRHDLIDIQVLRRLHHLQVTHLQHRYKYSTAHHQKHILNSKITIQRY